MMRAVRLAAAALAALACSRSSGVASEAGPADDTRAPSSVGCSSLSAKECTERRSCLLDRGAKGVVCRDAIGCELEVTALDLTEVAPLVRHEAFKTRCERNPACRYEDRGCFCPCGLSGFPNCNCACGGGLPARCAKKGDAG
jgi:hypothetical protein